MEDGQETGGSGLLGKDLELHYTILTRVRLSSLCMECVGSIYSAYVTSVHLGSVHT